MSKLTHKRVGEIALALMILATAFIWHNWKLESAWVNGVCANESFGYHSVYGGCQRFKRVKYQENGKTTWYEVPLGYYLTHQFKFDLPFGLYKLFPSYK